MAEPLTLRFQADTSRAQSAMASLAASVAGNMASIGVAMSGGAASSNNLGAALGTLQANAMRAAAAVGADLRKIATDTVAAATKDGATLEGIVRAATAAAAGSNTAQAAVQSGLAGTSTAIGTLVAQVPSLGTLLGAFVAFEAAKLVFDSVSASIDAAREHVEAFVRIGREAERVGVGTTFFQRATLEAEKLGLTAQQVTQALATARAATEDRIGVGTEARNTSPLAERLTQHVRAGNVTAEDRDSVLGADGQEARIRALLDLVDQLRARSRDLAALDLVGKVLGPDFERRMRDGVDITGRLREQLDATARVAGGQRIVSEAEIERGNQLDAKLKAIAETFATALAPIQKDISTAALDTYEAFLNVEMVIARVVKVAADLYAQVTGVVGAVKEAVGAIPGIGKVLTAGNHLTALEAAGRAVGLIDPEVQGPPAPLAVKVRPRGPDRSATLPSLHPKGEGDGLERLDAVETLINQIQKAADTAKAELENVRATNVEREKAVALAKAEAAAREDAQRGRRDSAALDADERSRVLAAAASWQTYRDRVMDAQQALRQTAEQARYFGQIAADSLADAILEGKSFADILGSLQKQLARAALQAVFTGQGPLAALLGTATKASAAPDAVGGARRPVHGGGWPDRPDPQGDGFLQHALRRQRWAGGCRPALHGRRDRPRDLRSGRIRTPVSGREGRPVPRCRPGRRSESGPSDPGADDRPRGRSAELPALRGPAHGGLSPRRAARRPVELMASPFHEVRFPVSLSYGSRGGPERRTEIVTLGSGDEERNSPWRHSRRSYNAGPALRSAADIATVLAFFEERRGQLHGFRWKDSFDHASCPVGQIPRATDQPLGEGDGTNRVFPLVKRYGAAFAPYLRPIRKPVAGSVSIAVAGSELAANAFSTDPTTGLVTLSEAPATGSRVTAGYAFDVPVRFATDRIEIDFQAVQAGLLADIPILEIRR